jgi:hypothetical protein
MKFNELNSKQIKDNTFIYGGGETFHALGWFRAYGKVALIAQSSKDEHYTHLYLDGLFPKYTNQFKYTLKPNFVEVDTEYEHTCLIKINDLYNFKLVYDLDGLWVGNVFTNDNKKVFKIDNIENTPLVNHESGLFLLSDYKKYKDQVVQFKEIIYKTNEEIKEVLAYDSDYQIVKNLNHALTLDEHGTLRFVKEKYTKKEKIMEKDINQTWHDYYNNKYNFPEMLKWYMKMGYSVSGFMDVFYSSFLVSNDSESILCPEEEIISIINGKLKSYDK